MIHLIYDLLKKVFIIQVDNYSSLLHINKLNKINLVNMTDHQAEEEEWQEKI